METEMLESIDKAILSMVSELTGRNESKRIGDLETTNLEAETSTVGRRLKRVGDSGDCMCMYAKWRRLKKHTKWRRE